MYHDLSLAHIHQLITSVVNKLLKKSKKFKILCLALHDVVDPCDVFGLLWSRVPGEMRQTRTEGCGTMKNSGHRARSPSVTRQNFLSFDKQRSSSFPNDRPPKRFWQQSQRSAWRLLGTSSCFSPARQSSKSLESSNQLWIQQSLRRWIGRLIR